MAETKPALVLHLVSGGEPLVFPLHADVVDEVASQVNLYLDHGSVQSIRDADDRTVHVNFAHVAAAYVDDLQRSGKVFGMR
ncbi:hypothetical protein FHS23_000453 [Prauserella isguenensis]|uniref:Uncharacterized protein n=1 Tax=Prauserella isguenensis TaxID=1470180 RepID=A0A839RUS9_9PSEU|nr:hypothetical protein [Prauserella isguenensis]MBB3049458.1 hypothetical protein [Prauserella isguenensis]